MTNIVLTYLGLGYRMYVIAEIDNPLHPSLIALSALSTRIMMIHGSLFILVITGTVETWYCRDNFEPSSPRMSTDVKQRAGIFNNIFNGTGLQQLWNVFPIVRLIEENYINVTRY